MVATFGMSDVVGLIHCAQRSPGPLIGLMPNGESRLDCSAALADQIDREVKQLLDAAYVEAKNILLAHREPLDVVARALIERETLSKAEFLTLIGRKVSDDRLEGDGRVDAFPPIAGS